MPFKKPAVNHERSLSSQSSRSDSEPASKRRKYSSPSEPSHSGSSSDVFVKIYILQTKLDSDTVSRLFHLVETTQFTNEHYGMRYLEVCKDVREAGVIITAIRMRHRLERHLDWSIAKSKAIVLPQWLFDSFQQGKLLPCGDYAALRDLREETAKNCPGYDSEGTATAFSPSSVSTVASADVPVRPSLKLSHTAKFSCCRSSPLVCINQDLVNELSIIKRSRELEGEERSSVSYGRAIAVIKAFPNKIDMHNLHSEVAKLPFIGAKLLSLIEEHFTNGFIQESRDTLTSSRFISLSAFNTIYGIGPTTARRLYAIGLRTIEDLEAYYGVEEVSFDDEEMLKPSGADETHSIVRSEEAATEMSIKLALSLRHDLAIKISRAEVAEMHRVVMRELDTLQEGCISTIVGGYRRGKLESGDVDIVITHPDSVSGANRVKGLCKRLVTHLHERGLVTHVMHLSSFREHNALRTSHWDSLEKALTIFVLPASLDDGRRIWRRLDLIFAAPEVYWTAVVGWTGSTMFERDLRRWADEKKGYRFDSSGITRRRDSKALYAKSEQEVFDLLDLPWVDPTLRNADA